MGFSDENGAKKFYFPEVPNQVLGRVIKSGQVGVQQTYFLWMAQSGHEISKYFLKQFRQEPFQLELIAFDYRNCPYLTFSSFVYDQIFVKFVDNQKEASLELEIYLGYAYQSLSCATAINTKFSELFSPKGVYVKYKNAILSHIDCSFRA